MNEVLFAKKLETAMEFKQLTRKELAYSTGVTSACIRKMCNPYCENSLPSRHTLFCLCNALEISAEYFLNEEVDPREIANFCRRPSGADWKKKQQVDKLCALLRTRCENLSFEALRGLEALFYPKN